MTTRMIRPLGVLLALTSFVSIAATAAAAPDPQIALRAGKADSLSHALASELAGTLNRPGSGSPRISIEESQGSVQNVMDAAQAKTGTLFTAPPNAVKEARRGDKPYGKNPRYRAVRALFPIPFQALHWVVRQDGDVKSFDDLATRPFIPGTRGSLAERQTAALLKLLGLDTRIQLIDIDSAAAPAALAASQVVGFAVAGPYPIAALTTLAQTVPIRLLSLSPDQVKQALANDGTTVALTIPKGTYRGVDEDTATVALPAGIFTTVRLSNADAYRITKAFWTGRDTLAENAPAWQAVVPSLLSALGIKLHPGALKYYREAGIQVPAQLR